MVVEHRSGPAGPVGIRQARYFGRVKTKFQLYLAATVANLTLVAGKIGLSGSTDGGPAGHRSSAMMSALWSPMRRPISAPSGSDNYGP